MQCAQIISGYFKFVIGVLVAIHSTKGPPRPRLLSLSTCCQCQEDQGQKQGQVLDEIVLIC